MVNYQFNIMNQELPSYSPNCIKIFLHVWWCILMTRFHNDIQML